MSLQSTFSFNVYSLKVNIFNISHWHNLEKIQLLKKYLNVQIYLFSKHSNFKENELGCHDRRYITGIMKN